MHGLLKPYSACKSARSLAASDGERRVFSNPRGAVLDVCSGHARPASRVSLPSVLVGEMQNFDGGDNPWRPFVTCE